MFPNLLSPKSYVVRQLVRQLIYTIFISNSHDSFHLWWKKNSVKNQKVSKYYDKDFLKNFLLLFMSLSTTPILKNSHFWAKSYFIFLKKVQYQTSKVFNTKFRPQWKDYTSSYQVKQVLSLFWKIVTIISS